MSLIRNGGFERGNTDFWTVESGGTLEIDSVNQKYGNYCGKYTAASTANEFIINDDYIDVNPFDLINLFLWAKSSATVGVYPCLYLYDADYSYMYFITGMHRIMNGSYLNIGTQVPIQEGIEYVRAGYFVSSSAGTIFYFDGYSVNILKADRLLSSFVYLAYLSGVTSSGTTEDDKQDMQMYNTFEADLSVSAAAGTSPTLDVKVYELNPGSDSLLVGTFSQATGPAAERITLTHCTGRQLYITYTIGGTDPYFEFMVYVTGKR